jgi:hypothetical protein
VIAVGTVHGWILNHPGMIDRVTFVLFDAETREAYESAHRKRKPSPLTDKSTCLICRVQRQRMK